MKLKFLSLAAVGAAVLFAGSEAKAQYGMRLSRGIYLEATLCGFDCSDPQNTYSNTWHATEVDSGGNTVPSEMRLAVRLYGDLNQPGFLFIGVGNPIACPGLGLGPAITNPMLLSNIIVWTSKTMTVANDPRRGYCAPAASGEILLPLTTLGVGTYTLQLQGAVFSGGNLTLTRAAAISVVP